MKKIIQISKKSLIRLGIFSAIILGAVLFDIYHEETPQDEQNTSQTSKNQSHEFSGICYYSSLNSFKLRSFSDRYEAFRVFMKTQSRFLQQYHNLKANQLAKSESINQYPPAEIMVHFLQLKKFMYRNPDDITVPLF